MKPIHFNNSYINLGDEFYVTTEPVPVDNPKLIKFNTELAIELGLPKDLNSAKGTAIFAGNTIPDGAEPLAMAYAGHQFGGFSPQLGDGRAILLGEIIAPNGTEYDFQLKGSGPTFYSRGGDGRSSLGPVLREFLVSEAMAKLGVPTTRALAAVTTGEEVARDRLLPGGILTRIAKGFVRVGTFQFLAARGNIEAIKKLADYVIERNYPEVSNTDKPYEALLNAIIDRQTVLIAKWMQLGFIHGVMNTDNMSIAGETIDYGPCAFMDIYSHDKIFSSIDHGKRYAYNNQPTIALWNLTRLAETFIPLLDDDTDAAIEIAKKALGKFSELYDEYWLAGMREKIGLSAKNEVNIHDDKELIETLLEIMADDQADFTLTFYYLTQAYIDPNKLETLKNLFNNQEKINDWLLKWQERIAKEELSDEELQKKMESANPIYIPRNHQIEAAIRAAEDNSDFSVFHDLHTVLHTPFEYQKGKDTYMLPPKPDEVVLQTFCGT